jgi:ribosome-associated protein
MVREKILTEIILKAVRSSGPGGQNVNKVSSKIVLSFNVTTSEGLTNDEKKLITSKLTSRLTADGILILNCDEDRSQLKNKEIVIKRFLTLLNKSLVVPKKRKPTKIPKAVIAKRLNNKAATAGIKKNRKKPDLDI